MQIQKARPKAGHNHGGSPSKSDGTSSPTGRVKAVSSESRLPPPPEFNLDDFADCLPGQKVNSTKTSERACQTYSGKTAGVKFAVDAGLSSAEIKERIRTAITNPQEIEKLHQDYQKYCHRLSHNFVRADVDEAVPAFINCMKELKRVTRAIARTQNAKSVIIWALEEHANCTSYLMQGVRQSCITAAYSHEQKDRLLETVLTEEEKNLLKELEANLAYDEFELDFNNLSQLADRGFDGDSDEGDDAKLSLGGDKVPTIEERLKIVSTELADIDTKFEDLKAKWEKQEQERERERNSSWEDLFKEYIEKENEERTLPESQPKDQNLYPERQKKPSQPAQIQPAAQSSPEPARVFEKRVFPPVEYPSLEEEYESSNSHEREISLPSPRGDGKDISMVNKRDKGDESTGHSSALKRAQLPIVGSTPAPAASLYPLKSQTAAVRPPVSKPEPQETAIISLPASVEKEKEIKKTDVELTARRKEIIRQQEETRQAKQLLDSKGEKSKINEQCRKVKQQVIEKDQKIVERQKTLIKKPMTQDEVIKKVGDWAETRRVQDILIKPFDRPPEILAINDKMPGNRSKLVETLAVMLEQPIVRRTGMHSVSPDKVRKWDLTTIRNQFDAISSRFTQRQRDLIIQYLPELKALLGNQRYPFVYFNDMEAPVAFPDKEFGLIAHTLYDEWIGFPFSSYADYRKIKSFDGATLSNFMEEIFSTETLCSLVAAFPSRGKLTELVKPKRKILLPEGSFIIGAVRHTKHVTLMLQYSPSAKKCFLVVHLSGVESRKTNKVIIECNAPRTLEYFRGERGANVAYHAINVPMVRDNGTSILAVSKRKKLPYAPTVPKQPDLQSDYHQALRKQMQLKK